MELCEKGFPPNPYLAIWENYNARVPCLWVLTGQRYTVQSHMEEAAASAVPKGREKDAVKDDIHNPLEMKRKKTGVERKGVGQETRTHLLFLKLPFQGQEGRVILCQGF